VKNWLDRTFFLTDEEIQEEYEVDGRDYLWVAMFIFGGLFTMFIALQWWVVFN